MGGMKYIALLAVLAAAVAASDEWDTRECTYCPPCQVNNPFNGPVSDVCSYCHCDEALNPSKHHCPERQEFDPNVQECVPSTRCGGEVDDRCKEGKDAWCRECYHGMDIRYPSTDPCGYCQCLDDGGAKFEECPPGMGWDEDQCVEKDECCTDNGCAGLVCPPCFHGMNFRFPDSLDNCGFCCCEPDSANSTNEIAVHKDCPENMVFDENLNRCVYDENVQCHKKHCHTTTPPPVTFTTPITCPPPPKDCEVSCPVDHYGEHFLMQDPNDPCKFCCCIWDEAAGMELPQPRICQDPSDHYNPTTKRCESGGIQCPSPPPQRPDGCHDPNDIDGCWIVKDLCKTDADGHLPNPYQDRSFCQCDFDRIHWMPCAPGTQRYVDSLGACV